MKNVKYAAKMLRIIEENTAELGFSLSAPSKIAGDKKSAFSLPAGPDFSCPGATEACKGCYAQKQRFIFSNVQKLMARNWRTYLDYKDRNDVTGAAKEIASLIDKKLDLFRISESGDLDSDFAVQMWAAVARLLPNTKFFGYTRSFHLDVSPLVSLPNVQFWASTDPYNLEVAQDFVNRNKQYGIKHAYGPWDHATPIPENSFICPSVSGKIPIESACSKCKLCIVKDRTTKNVVFLKH